MIHSCKKCGTGRVKISESYLFNDVYECLDCGHWRYKRIEECCRRPFFVVAILRYNHERYAIFNQCLECGGAEKTKPLKSKDYTEHIRCAFNQDRFKQWKVERKNEGDLLQAGVKVINYQHSNAYKYQTYLQSKEWKAKRILVLNRDNHLCQVCKSEPALDIHHLSYENCFDEPLEDLQAVCRSCHINLHKSENVPDVTANDFKNRNEV